MSDMALVMVSPLGHVSGGERKLEDPGVGSASRLGIALRKIIFFDRLNQDQACKEETTDHIPR
jgi:hypothetical protein